MLRRIIEFIISIFKKEEPILITDTFVETGSKIKKIDIDNKRRIKVKIIINNSKDDDFYSQTNNERDPYISCFPTSMINGSQVIKWPLPKTPDKIGDYKQPEDQFDWFLHNDPECVKFWSKQEFKYYVDVSGNDPRELWDVEVFSFRKWCGINIDHMKIDLKVQNLQDFIDVLNNGGAIVTSGNFCGFNHIVTIVGYVAEVPEGKDKYGVTIDDIVEFIIDDSYGNMNTGYKPCGVSGNDVHVNKNDFLQNIVKGSNDNIKLYFAIYFIK